MNISVRDLPPNQRIFVCSHLANLERRIVYVFHDLDGEIQMLCGQSDCDVEDAENCKIGCLSHLIEFDATLLKIEDFAAGTEAWHDPKGDWIFTPMATEEPK